ncbi:MAG: amino acid ABC transporter ATP-binding protein [Clostridia bacterium]|nr:amino acid ABC transporter ATP-binding protein [Clostridia bacterium]
MIEVKHLRKAYAAATPIEDMNVTINDGEVVSVIGPSGTGKSTFIRCINRLETPTSGSIIVDGICVTDKKCNLSAVRKKMGMVFQSFNLFGHLTVIENVMMPQIDLLGADRQTAYNKAMELLRLVGLDGRAMQYPHMLSGGQKQRVAIARTLSTDPDIILFDEPTSALDPTMVGEVQSVIRRLAETGKTMLIVTHELKFAKDVSSRVLFLTNGGIYEDGTPEQIFDHPQKELTRRFIRQLKVYEHKPDGTGFDFPAVINGMEQFCISNRISRELTGKLLAATEELTTQIVIPEIKDDRIYICVEYDENRQTVYAKYRYGKDAFDPRSSENATALAILDKQYAELEHNTSDGDEYANEVILHIR